MTDTQNAVVSTDAEAADTSANPAWSAHEIVRGKEMGFKGVMVIRYTVMDKTGDVSRQTDGRVRELYQEGDELVVALLRQLRVGAPTAAVHRVLATALRTGPCFL